MSTFVLSSPASGGLKNRINYQAELNQEQLDVVLHGDGPCLVLAGAGSGKTRTITYRVAYLLEQGVDPSLILLLTFTNKAAKEMLQRVGALVGPQAARIWGGTFHSVASRLLRSCAETLGYHANFSIFDADDADDLVKAVMKDLLIDPKARRFPSPSVVQNILSYARNTQRSIEEVLTAKHPHFAQFASEIVTIGIQYQERKKASNAMDFDDLLSLMALALEDEKLCQGFSQMFCYVLVDEYQDTNAIQARIVKGFGATHQNVLVVGDDAQSIYAFRGADVKNILSFPKQWPGAKMFKLLTNYRSVPEILELANDSLNHNTEKFEKELIAMRSSGPKPKLVPCTSAAQEARYIADQILQLRAEGTALANMAVLFRSSAHSQALEFELMKRDLPYEYRGGQKFFERAHIKDLVAFLRAAANPADEVAWLRILGLQTGIGATTAGNLAKRAVRIGTFADVVQAPEMLALSGRGRVGWQEFMEIGESIVARAPWPAGMIRAVLDSSYRSSLEREYPNWRERLEDLEQLARFAESYEDVSRFLGDIALYDEVMGGRTGDTAQPGEERIILSTIHQAKGLEWDAVFIIHLADTAFPNRRAMAEEGGMEEERRLFYVAVTRARRHLVLSYPMTMGYDALAFNQMSTFLEEVPPRLFDRIELIDSTGRPGFANRPKRPWEWGASDDGSQVAPWQDEPVIDRDFSERPNYAPRMPSKTVWKPKASLKKPPPNSTEISYLPDLE
jgi:DNA helicase-2/ATP-dependent DNA helicase PcrA